MSASLGAGDVKLTLNGDELTLRPSLRAAQAISRHGGGIRAVLKAVADVDLDMITYIIAVGLGKEPKDIEDKVWLNGLGPLVEPVTTFVIVIANGGRLPKGGEEKADPPKSE